MPICLQSLFYMNDLSLVCGRRFRETFWIFLTIKKLVLFCRAVGSGKCSWQQKLNIAKVWLELGAFHHWGLWEKTNVSVSWGSSWEFRACCSSCQAKGEISQCMGASAVLKHTKRSFFGAAVNEMDPFFCGWRDPRKSWVSGWICSAQLGWDFKLTLSLGCSIFATSLCSDWIWQNQKNPCSPKLLMITLVLTIFCVFHNKPLLLFIAPDLHPRKLFLRTISEVWESCALKTSLKFCEICYMWSKAHFTILC